MKLQTKGYTYFDNLLRKRLKSDLTRAAMKRFEKYTKLKRPAVLRALTVGNSDPKLEVTAFRDQKYGYYPQGGGDIIQINDLIVKQYGVILGFRMLKDKHDQTLVEKLIDAVETRLLAVVYHEMVHWGDYTSDLQFSDRPNQKPDWGTKWEREVYGMSMSTDEIQDCWGLWIHKDKNNNSVVVPYLPENHTGLQP